ncbi:MAG: NlpC/P60 family protein [Tissierellia bacterium]|nr:NlpC/P60 family protein [Tissierellia bacterium]
MKKFFVLMIGLFLLHAPPIHGKEAIHQQHQIRLDQEEVMISSYNIDGYNYFKLRDIAKSMADSYSPFQVSFDSSTKTVLLEKGISYTGSMESNPSMDKKSHAEISGQQVKIDGQNVNIEAYIIHGNNYFKLRDLGNALGFYVGYNPDNQQIIIESTRLPERELPVIKKPVFNGHNQRVDLDEGFYVFNSSTGADINLPKGILLTFKNDIIQSAKVVEGKVRIPKEGFCFFERTDQGDEFKKDYILNAPVGVLLTLPISLEGIDSSIRPSQVVAFSFMGNKNSYTEYIFDIDALFELLENENLSIYQGNSDLIFKEIQKGNRIGNLYWAIAEFKDFAQQKEAMIAYAINALGTPYSTYDCSGLVSSSMAAAGLLRDAYLYTWTIDYSPNFDIVPMSQLKRGDILSKAGENGHMMLYLGNGKVIESQPREGVVIKNVRKQGYTVYRIKSISPY